MPDYSPPSLTFPDPREATNPAGTVTKSRIPHPYARIYTMKEENKKGAAEGKRRKIWSHNLTLEKSLFSLYELYGFSALDSACQILIRPIKVNHGSATSAKDLCGKPRSTHRSIAHPTARVGQNSVLLVS